MQGDRKIYARNWLLSLTLAGAVAGYALSILGGAGGADVSTGPAPPFWLMALAGAGAGLGIGLVLSARVGRWAGSP